MAWPSSARLAPGYDGCALRAVMCWRSLTREGCVLLLLIEGRQQTPRVDEESIGVGKPEVEGPGGVVR